MLTVALYQPDIAQNTGTLIRTCACLGARLAVIEPCGFVFGDKFMQRAAMDYAERAAVERHIDWSRFMQSIGTRRLVAVETPNIAPASVSYTAFTFQSDDVLLLGPESRGLPPVAITACAAAVYIPMQAGERSLNLAIAGAMVLGEALRQTTR
jgi:tRNA (cytidine/uridine-2'-O-)-methyltransferase